MSDEEILIKVGELFSKMEANNKLQRLAKDNGLSVKNTVELTEEAKDNLAVSIVSLLLAKRENDVRYKTLTRVGLQKRSLKAEIVNAYKEQAMALISRYKTA